MKYILLATAASAAFVALAHRDAAAEPAVAVHPRTAVLSTVVGTDAELSEHRARIGEEVAIAGSTGSARLVGVVFARDGEVAYYVVESEGDRTRVAPARVTFPAIR